MEHRTLNALALLIMSYFNPTKGRIIMETFKVAREEVRR
jgi:hypothetical protein